MHKTTARVGSNIAFVKYWGVANADLNIPLNSSVSMTLADAHTTTTVEWDAAETLQADDIEVDGTRLIGDPAGRAVRHLDRIRDLACVSCWARVVSANNFPMASGIASSASGFAALTVAACRALELNLDSGALSALARRGSGSASRSMYGGFVLWERGTDHASSVGHQIFSREHWNLQDIVAVISRDPKSVSSAGGHKLAATSPLNSARVAKAEELLPKVIQAIRNCNLKHLGPAIELDALAMHAVMMTSTPSLNYWLPGTLEILHAVRSWRQDDGIDAYFTIDAGPNVHILCECEDVPEMCRRLESVSSVQQLIVSGPGPGPQETEDHLF